VILTNYTNHFPLSYGYEGEKKNENLKTNVLKKWTWRWIGETMDCL